MGIILALIAGLVMALQGIFNTRLMEVSSTWAANMVTHAMGLVVCVLIWLLSGRTDIRPIFTDARKVYLLSGILGTVIVYAVIKSIDRLGPCYAVMLFLTAQLITAYLIELFGLFGTEAVSFEWKKLLAMVAIVFGIILFKV